VSTYGELQYAVDKADGRGYWGIKAQPHVMIRIKRIFPRVQASRTGWVAMVNTPDVARDIEWLLGRWPMDMTPEVTDRLAICAGEHREREHAVDAILSGQLVAPMLGEPAREPRPYQLVAAQMARTTKRLLIADDLGLGKTLEALLVLDAEDALPALVVTLTHLPRQWLGELGATWPWLRGHVVTTRKPYELSRARGMRGSVPDVVIMNYAKLSGWSDVLAGQVRTVIFDECQELRHGAMTDKGRAAAHIAGEATYVQGLSATPVFNYGGEIHSILDIISPDSLGSRPEFLREWSGAELGDGKIAVKDPAALGTYLRDAGLMLRRTRKDVHRELPEPLRIRQEVDADPAAIDQLGQDALAMARMLLDDQSDRRQKFVVAGKLDWKLRQATGIGKAPYVAAFVRMLLESEDKVVLFGWHRACYQIWLDQLADLHPVLYTGTESSEQKMDAAERFVHGDARVLVMSLRSGAGLDGLQEASSVAVFGELDWSPEVHTQCIGRLARDGQESTVAAYFLVCNDGADPVMDEVLELKRGQAEGIRDPNLPLFSVASTQAERMARALLERSGASGQSEKAG
jgi:SNF2-related domain